jgi:molybdate transport system regulatory protein
MKREVKVWVTFSDELKFGEGRAQLLELIEKYGSLQQAAKDLGMSYRNAWGYLGQLERAAGFTFVQRAPGGGPRSGMRLTLEAKRFLGRYRRFRHGLDRAVKAQFEKAFGGIDPRQPDRDAILSSSGHRGG